MNKTPRKRRGPWIDLLLISTIFILGTAIVYLTVLSEEPIFSMKEDTFTEATSNISEEESSFPGVRIVTDISNDEKMPFAIQYPLTKFESFNEVILAYIEASKDYYISTMRLQDVKEHTG